MVDPNVHRFEDQHHARVLRHRCPLFEASDDVFMHLFLGHSRLIIAGDDGHLAGTDLLRRCDGFGDLLADAIVIFGIIHSRRKGPGGELGDLDAGLFTGDTDLLQILVAPRPKLNCGISQLGSGADAILCRATSESPHLDVDRKAGLAPGERLALFHLRTSLNGRSGGGGGSKSCGEHELATMGIHGYLLGRAESNLVVVPGNHHFDSRQLLTLQLSFDLGILIGLQMDSQKTAICRVFQLAAFFDKITGRQVLRDLRQPLHPIGKRQLQNHRRQSGDFFADFPDPVRWSCVRHQSKCSTILLDDKSQSIDDVIDANRSNAVIPQQNRFLFFKDVHLEKTHPLFFIDPEKVGPVSIIENILTDRPGGRLLGMNHHRHRFLCSLSEVGIEEDGQTGQMVAVAMGDEKMFHTELKIQIAVETQRSGIETDGLINQVGAEQLMLGGNSNSRWEELNLQSN